MGLVLSSIGGRVHDVVGAQHDDTSVWLEVGVDVVHLDELLVGHVGLGQEHVHVPGMRPATGWIA
jgi:hypothetical protein